jgi:hypothetical protein
VTPRSDWEVPDADGERGFSDMPSAVVAVVVRLEARGVAEEVRGELDRELIMAQ